MSIVLKSGYITKISKLAWKSCNTCVCVFQFPIFSTCCFVAGNSNFKSTCIGRGGTWPEPISSDVLCNKTVKKRFYLNRCNVKIETSKISF